MKFKQGTVTGTGNAINVEVGFVPDYVKVVNANAAAEEIMVLESFKEQADGDSFATKGIAPDGTNGVLSTFVESANGLSEYDTGEFVANDASDPVIDSGFAGFIIPAAFNDNSDVMHYIAMAE